MRSRITLFHHNEDAIEPKSLKVEKHSISGPDVRAVREDRLTLGLEELPSELQELLRVTHELHIRWSSPIPYETIGPWTSRLSPGLHVFFTPQKDENVDQQNISTQLCSFLRKVGPVDCISINKSFTKLSNERFSHSSAYQYYQPLAGLAPLLRYAREYVCSPSDEACSSQIQQLGSVTLLDFSYDTISHVAKITAMWKHETQPISITSQPGHRVEFGLLTPDFPSYMQDNELGATGLLTVVGDDSEAKPTLFTFPSRHKKAFAVFSSKFLKPMGLHPNMQLVIKSNKPPMEDFYCSIHAYLTLPRTVFADKYQLEDPLFLASKNLSAVRYISQPVDLEAPDYAMNIWGSSVLLELQRPAESVGQFTAEIPLHLRYQTPQHGGERPVEVPYPVIFWACSAEDGTKFPNNPFDRVNLGYDGLFGPRTLFWHLDPVPQGGAERLMMEGSVPVLNLDETASIGTMTGIVVLLGFAWVVWKLLAVYFKIGYSASQKKARGNKKTQ